MKERLGCSLQRCWCMSTTAEKTGSSRPGRLPNDLKSTLIGVTSLAPLPPPPPTGDLALGETIPGELQEIKDTLEGRRKSFHMALGERAARADWRGLVEFPSSRSRKRRELRTL